MTLSYLVTLLSSTWGEILEALNPPAFELEFLQGIPLHGYPLAILVSIPFLLTVALIVRARPCFNSSR